MKKILIGVVAVLLVVAGITVVTALSADNEQTENIECSDCGNACTLERNCGLSSCGAVSGRSCGCGG